jgi:hypothetical protein
MRRRAPGALRARSGWGDTSKEAPGDRRQVGLVLASDAHRAELAVRRLDDADLARRVAAPPVPAAPLEADLGVEAVERLRVRDAHLHSQ